MPTSLTYKSHFQEEYEEDEDRQYFGNEGAGALFLAKDTGRFLMFLRSYAVNEPGTWNLVGGKMDDDETPVQAVEREVAEETGYSGDFTAKLLYTFQHRDFRYYNHLVIVPTEFNPTLNWEHKTAMWVEYGNWPTPLHFGFANVIKHAGNKLQHISQLLKKKKDKLQEFDAPPLPPPAIVQKIDKPATNTVVDKQALTNIFVVIATLYKEASGEGEVGMQAVMNVIMHRAKGDFNKAMRVALVPEQFSCWNGVADPIETSFELGRSLLKNKTSLNGKAYATAKIIATQAMNGELKDITGGATHYYNPRKANPSWAKPKQKKGVRVMKKTATIGNHVFYK